jgi:tripartite-type tricarboxylate transporter receptor subunit TctC
MNSPGTIALATVLCTLIGVAPWRAIAADDYPSRPVTVIVPFTPGGSTDIMARHEAEVLQRALGQRFVVENRPGAGGEIGISYAAKAAPDGYTLLHAPSIIILLPYVMKSVSYDLAKDFAPVMLTGLTQFALVVSPTLPVNSVKDLIALAKSKPGELTYASSGIGTPHQIFAEEFKTMTGTDIRHIPYKGAVPGLTDIASGNVSMEFVDIPPALPLIHAGKLKVLAVLSVKGNSELPGVPPLAETVPGYDASSWQGFFARAGTPQPIVDKLNAALAADFKRSATVDRFNSFGIVAQWDTPSEFAAFITEQSTKWVKVIRAAGIRVTCARTRANLELNSKIQTSV